MKNKRKTRLPLAAAAICLLSAVPVQASAISQNILDFPQEGTESVSYIIDFLDYDGSLLDSKVCMYGEKLEDIKVPGQREDEQFIYQFAGWEPQISEIVTDCALYMAVYQRKAKSDADGDGNGFELEMPEQLESSPKVLSNGTTPEKTDQIYAISYDVISFQIETQEEEQEEDPAPPMEETETSDKPPVSETPLPETVLSKEPDRINKTVPPENEKNSQQLFLPSVSGSEDMSEPTEIPANIHTDAIFSSQVSTDDSNIRKEKKKAAPLLQTEHEKPPKKAQKTLHTSQPQETTEISAKKPIESQTPAPSLKKSGQVSGKNPFVSLLPGILAGCIGSIIFLFMSRKNS